MCLDMFLDMFLDMCLDIVLDPLDLRVSQPNKDEVQSNIRIYSNPFNEDSIIQGVS